MHSSWLGCGDSGFSGHTHSRSALLALGGAGAGAGATAAAPPNCIKIRPHPSYHLDPLFHHHQVNKRAVTNLPGTLKAAESTEVKVEVKGQSEDEVPYPLERLERSLGKDSTADFAVAVDFAVACPAAFSTRRTRQPQAITGRRTPSKMLDDREIDAAVNQLAAYRKDDTLNDILARYETLLGDYKRLKSDYEEEREAREKWKQQARGQERNPFVLVLVDADGYVFDDDCKPQPSHHAAP